MTPNQRHRLEHVAISQQTYDSDRCSSDTSSSSSSSASSSFKSAHDQIAPIVTYNYGLRQRRGGARRREEQQHIASTNGFYESWKPNGFNNLDGFDNLDGSWKPDGFNNLDGSWKPDGFDNLEVQNGSEGGYGDADDDNDGGSRGRCMDASDERGKHADEDVDDDDHIHEGIEDNDDDGEGEKEGHIKSSMSPTIKKEDVSSSSPSCSKPRRGEPLQEEKRKLKLEKLKRSKKKLHDYMCCRCASRLTVDCAAVCCCPLALVHLAVLALIRLPTSLLWRMLINLKSRMCAGRPPIQELEEQGSARSVPRGGLSDADVGVDGSSSSHRGIAVFRFESQKLWQHFGTGDFGFGGFPMRAD